jgi:hypothetical protein
LKKLNHTHLIALVGTYTQAMWIGMLLHPVAVCDLSVFFEDAEAFWSGTIDSEQTTRLKQLGYELKSPLKHRAWLVLVLDVSYLLCRTCIVRRSKFVTRISSRLTSCSCGIISTSATSGALPTFRPYRKVRQMAVEERVVISRLR